MANRVQQIVLTKELLGNKIQAVFKAERDIRVDGSPVRGRVFTASSSTQPDFEIYVPHLRNSQLLKGRQEVRLVNPVVRIVAKRNNIGNSRSIDMVVYADRLEVVKKDGGQK